jgi:AcrR family transcriptional regulator
LLDAFAALLVERGFDAVNTHHIAERAGVPVGTLYQFFPNKFALATALSRRYMDRQRTLIESVSSDAIGGLRVDEFVDNVIEGMSATLVNDEVLSVLWAVQQAVPELRSVLEEEEALRMEFGIKFFRPLLPHLEEEALRRATLTTIRVWYAMLFAASQEQEPRRGETMEELKRLTKAYLRCFEPA